jgi:uncharacterized membrane protein YphA (DoxX/SURF4 family)
MAILHQLDKWSTTHPRLLLLLRAALGIALVSKGISFISDIISLKALLAESSFGFLPDWIALVITWIHLLCGFSDHNRIVYKVIRIDTNSNSYWSSDH